MTALKLFVSHSSRLDDVPHRYTDDDANWRLLGEVCDKLKARYGTAIQILVDRDGLIPGDDWNQELNLWLAECHAAVVLVSKRALERSDWVAKEAAIFGWRRALDPNFLLIPVTIEGESEPVDLAEGFFGSLELGRIQCPHAQRDAQDIVEKVATRLGQPEELAARCGQTPLDLLRLGVVGILADKASPGSLALALKHLGPDESDLTMAGLSDDEQCAHRLARRLLRSSVHDIWQCFDIFRTILDCRLPPLEYEHAKWLFKLVRALWVHPGAAAFFRTALGGKPAVALCGEYLSRPGPNTGSISYTLERHVERAWSYPESSPHIVALARADTPLEDIRAMIDEKVLRGHPNPQSPGAKKALNRKPIVLFVSASEDTGGAPDVRNLRNLTNLAQRYAKLVIVFACCDPADALPEGMRSIVPSLDKTLEDHAYSAELAETIDLEEYERSL